MKPPQGGRTRAARVTVSIGDRVVGQGVVVATAHAGIPEAVDDGGSGLLVKEGALK